MRSLYRTLSFRYMSRRWLRTALIALSVGLGVATLVATQALNWTMARAAVFAANPTSGFADFIIANGELPVPRSLEKELAQVAGVAEVEPRIFDNAVAPQLGDRAVLVLGIDAVAAAKKKASANDPIQVSEQTQKKFGLLMLASKVPIFGGPPPALVGRELFKALPEGTKTISLRRGKAAEPKDFALAGPVDAAGNAAALAGFVAMMDLGDAARLFGLPPDQVHRFDITLKAGADPIQARADLEKVLNGRALVRTFAEQSQNTQNVMAGMQTGFSLCGLAALVVGLFLVYNALSVTVTERRHEIGILRSLGATRGQVLSLFAGEAVLLGFIGSLVGIPMGIGMANLGLGPMQAMLGDVFFAVDARQVDVSWFLYGIATFAGVVTTLLASLLPAFRASHEKPADAVRKIFKAASVQSLVAHIAASALLIGIGTVMIFARDYLPPRWGTLGGMCIVLVGGLLASPFVSGILARLIQPFARRFLSIEWRLAADNIVRSPGRTGLVIGALGAGVSLVVQTAGVICSNREAVTTWADDALAADLIVTTGGPVGAGGQTQPMPDSLLQTIRGLEGVEGALPVRIRKIPWGGVQILMLAAEAGEAYRFEKSRNKKQGEVELYRLMDETPQGVLVSANLAALHKVNVGDTLKIPSPSGEVSFKVMGAITDYSWTHGTLFISRRDYVKYWGDVQCDVIDVFLKPGVDSVSMKTTLLSRWGASHGMFALTRADLKTHIDEMVEKIYSVAYAQLFVMMLVAGLGVVTALSIAVLQRQHEMGLLRAVGASRGQVILSVLAEACLMGVIGAFIGIVVGVPLEWYVLHIVILEDAGMLFPVVLPWKEALLVLGGALLTAMIAGLGPALYAVRQRIPDSIAYE
jgi:putative ABC transport system permease protein